MQIIKNIIFDYGNVIFEINFKRAQDALKQLGISNIEGFFAHKDHNNLFDDFETATISPIQFRDGIRKAANNNNLSDAEIDEAWNSLLIGVSANNHDVLTTIKKKYRTFLLSNNNEIHYNWIINYVKSTFNVENYDGLFEKAYFSHLMKLRKPNVNIFEQVMKENNLNPAETLFIDDSPQHIAGAKKAGLQTLLMDVHPSELINFLHKNGIMQKFTSLKEFYPFYLSEHRNFTSRVLHFIGTGLVFLTLIAAILFHNWQFFVAIPFIGYGFAWVGHFFFEKNKPATFQYPGYSLASDFILFFDLLTGKQSFKVK